MGSVEGRGYGAGEELALDVVDAVAVLHALELVVDPGGDLLELFQGLLQQTLVGMARERLGRQRSQQHQIPRQPLDGQNQPRACRYVNNNIHKGKMCEVGARSGHWVITLTATCSDETCRYRE